VKAIEGNLWHMRLEIPRQARDTEFYTAINDLSEIPEGN
jgi:hypothetical protein